MGNVPLCVPKKGGPIVFTERYNFQTGGHPLSMNQYHPYESSLEDLCSPELPRTSVSSPSEGNRRQSLLIGDPIVGIEIDQESVRCNIN